jgi:hypothetical protein
MIFDRDIFLKVMNTKEDKVGFVTNFIDYIKEKKMNSVSNQNFDEAVDLRTIEKNLDEILIEIKKSVEKELFRVKEIKIKEEK